LSVSQEVSEVTADMLHQRSSDTSMQTVAASAVEVGLCSGWDEVGSIEALKEALLTSPVVLDMPFYESMRELGRFGEWSVAKAPLIGRHCVTVTAYSRGMFTILNSNGWRWGSDGRVFVWEPEMGRLFDGGAKGIVLK